MTDAPLDPALPSAGDAAAGKKRSGGLSTMLIADLKSMAAGLGVAGAGSMKKAQLVDAIKGAQSGARSGGSGGSGSAPDPVDSPAPPETSAETPSDTSVQATSEAPARTRVSRRTRGSATTTTEVEPTADRAAPEPPAAPAPAADEQPATTPEPERQSDRAERAEAGDDQQGGRQRVRNRQRGQGQDDQPPAQPTQQPEPSQGQPNQNQPNQNQPNQNQPNQNQRDDQQGDQEGDGEGRRNRRRRGRDRNRGDLPPGQTGQGNGQGQQGNGNQGGGNQGNQGQGGQGNGNQGGQGGQGQGGGQGGQHRHQREPDTTILEDDVLVPAAGILDVLDNYAFVRTSGYLPGPDDVYVSLSMVRKYGLRRGDALMGQVRQPREGERKEKFNPMVRIESVNGSDPDASRHRPEFATLTPVHPTERLRMETDPVNVLGRFIDLASPVGKGQRGLLVAPSKAGRTTVLQSIAASVTANNPECHLMVVLVDERPEEITDFERSIKGEVISSTFDRPPGDHAVVAELAVERAKRLVELGHDVVVLLDGITRLGRAYHLASSTGGRPVPGGVDPTSLHPPKRFLGAARNVEDGGSLTILATAVVDSGSTIDEVIFDEVAGTANLELRLRGDLAQQRLFPAIDAVASGTRREELLMSEQELAIVWKLRRALSELSPEQAHELLLARLRKTQTNIELLMQVQQRTPSVADL